MVLNFIGSQFARDKGVTQLRRVGPLNGNYARDAFPRRSPPHEGEEGRRGEGRKRFCRIKCTPRTHLRWSISEKLPEETSISPPSGAFRRIENASAKREQAAPYYTEELNLIRSIYTDNESLPRIPSSKNTSKELLRNYAKTLIDNEEKASISFSIIDQHRNFERFLSSFRELIREWIVYYDYSVFYRQFTSNSGNIKKSMESFVLNRKVPYVLLIRNGEKISN